jgi:hypothetical protein
MLLTRCCRCLLFCSKKMYSDAYPDYLRMTALNLPAALLVLGFLFSLDDLTGAHCCCAAVLLRFCVCWASCSAWTTS